MATREEDLTELYRRGLLNEQQSAAVEELATRGRLNITPTQEQPISEPPEDELGILDYLMGTGEVATTMVTGAVAEPLSGIGGIAASLWPGEEGQGAAAVEKIQEAMTYLPKSRGGRAVAEKIGKILTPIAKPIGEAVETVGQYGYEKGGPIGGAAAKTLLAAIPEVLGLKGTRIAKKLALKRMVKDTDVSELYDELGNLLPEIKKGLDESGIDISEIEDILPSPVAEEQIKGAAERVGEAAKARIRPGPKAGKIAEEIQPSAEILAAADELGVGDQLLASHVSKNPTYVAVEQGLKSIPGSQLAAREKALVADLAERADNLITEFGGEIDKSLLSDQFRTDSIRIIRELEDQASNAYDKVNTALPSNTRVSAPKTTKMIADIADEMGGIEYLGAKEKDLLKVLSPETKPTYARLDRYRKQIGEALRKNSGPFKDGDEAALKRLYGALSQDQQLYAEAMGAGDLYKTASALVVNRKTIEKQLSKVIGKDLAGSITAKGRPAILALQKGDTKQFDDLLVNIPEGLGQDIKRSVVVTALNDAFVQGSRAERSLNLPGFDDFMKGLKRHKGAYNRLSENIGADAMHRLELLHTVVSGVRKAQQSAITTGRITAVPGMFDSADNLASRLFGTAKRVAAAEGVSTAVGVPGAGTTGVLAAALTAKRGARSVAADEFLSSAKFRRLLKKKASGKFDTENKLKKAEKSIEKLKAYKKWKDTLPERDLKDLTTVGAIGYLTGHTIEE